MTPAALVLLAAAPCVYWTQGIDSRPALESAGIKRLCVPPEQAETWRRAGFTVSSITEAELAAREALATPRVTARAGFASPTRSPLIVANCWSFIKAPPWK